MNMILPMGFDDENFIDRNNEIYNCVPYPGTRAVVWAGRDDRDSNRCIVNLYFDPPLPGACTDEEYITWAPNRCLPHQDPIYIDYDPLVLQARIFDLVERYKATLNLPTEVTNERTTCLSSSRLPE